MRDLLRDLRVDPDEGAPLQLIQGRADLSGEWESGSLVAPSGRTYPVTNYIPRFVRTEDEGQRQTERSFGFKWRQTETYKSEGMIATSRDWLVSRYGFESVSAMERWMASREAILDAGCGGGWSASLWMTPAWNGRAWVGADISEAIDVARTRLAGVPNTHFVQADILDLPFARESFDTVFSEGVLHHTPSTERAFKALVPLLKRGGEIMVYVYKKKSPLREYADDYIRDAVASMPPEKAWEQMRALTDFGRALAETKATVDVRVDVPFLDIPAGTHDIQRLVYWHFAKLFWNDAYTFDENHHINFDWYHPRYAHRQTAEQLRQWCADTGLSVTRLDDQQSGYTLRAIKP